MLSILFRSEGSERDLLLAELWEAGTLGVIEEPAGLRAFFDSEPAAASVREKYRTSILEEREESRVAPEFSKHDWDPIFAGKHFWIAPSWIQQSPPPDRLALIVDATNAFGSGRHESTQLMLEAMEDLVTPDTTVIDIGCGSGILSRAALLLGAQRVFACDIHEDALRAVHVPAFTGSADAIRPEQADLLLVNISARIIDLLAGELKRITKPCGVILLAGFIAENPPRLFKPEESRSLGEWALWICRREGITAESNASGALSHPAFWW